MPREREHVDPGTGMQFVFLARMLGTHSLQRERLERLCRPGRNCRCDDLIFLI